MSRMHMLRHAVRPQIVVFQQLQLPQKIGECSCFYEGFDIESSVPHGGLIIQLLMLAKGSGWRGSTWSSRHRINEV